MRETRSIARVLVVAVAAAVLLGTIASGTASAAPATSTTSSFEAVLNNPCNGHPIAVSGTIHSVYTTTRAGTISHSNQQASGVDLVTGARYQVVSVALSTNLVTPGVARVETQAGPYKFIGAGDAPDFRAHFTYHITRMPEPVTEVLVDVWGCES